VRCGGEYRDRRSQHNVPIFRLRKATSARTMTGANPTQDGIWIIDADGRTSYVNERMAEILGECRSEIVGRSSFDYIFPDDLHAAQHLFDAKRDGDIRAFGFKLRRKDGTAVLVEVQGTPMFSAAGAFKGIVGTFTISD